MRLYVYPEKVAMLERKINAYAQQKVEFGAQGVAEKVAEIEAVIAEKVAELDRPAQRCRAATSRTR